MLCLRILQSLTVTMNVLNDTACCAILADCVPREALSSKVRTRTLGKENKDVFFSASNYLLKREPRKPR